MMDPSSGRVHITRDGPAQRTRQSGAISETLPGSLHPGRRALLTRDGQRRQVIETFQQLQDVRHEENGVIVALTRFFTTQKNILLIDMA
jgi:hypothetical protein